MTQTGCVSGANTEKMMFFCVVPKPENGKGTVYEWGFDDLERVVYDTSKGSLLFCALLLLSFVFQRKLESRVGLV